FFIFRISHRALVSPLRRLPGPWYTNITGLVRRYYAWKHKEHEYYMRLFDKYGPLVRASPDRVGVGEVGDFKKIMSSHSMTKTQMYTDFAAVGENIFTTRNPEFNKARRRQIGPAFTAPSIRRMEFLVMADGVDRLCQLLDSQIAATGSDKGSAAVVNMYYAFTMMTTDIISSLAFGLSSATATTTNPAMVSAEAVMNYTMGTMMLMGKMAEFPVLNSIPASLIPPGLKKLYDLRDDFVKFSEDTVAARRAELEDQKNGRSPVIKNRHDILQAFIEAQDPTTGARLNDKEIGSECIVLLAAGTDTVSNTLVSCIRLLLRYPDAYKRVCDEVRHAFPDGPSSVSFEKVKELTPYLQAVVHETLRLRPATSGVWPRDSPREGITLQGYFIPHGITLCGSVGGVHLNPRTWVNPTHFDPERFLGPDSEERKQSVVSFSTGARICPGRHLAMMELLLTMSVVLLKYDFALLQEPDMSADYYNEVEEMCRITTGHQYPERDCNVAVSKR
ncbi:cytochrome P450, partial [Martensiomyces pterosporus]